MSTNTSKESKLPKWAQDELTLRRRRVAEIRSQLDSVAKPVDRNADGVAWLDTTSETLYRGVKSNHIRLTHKDISVSVGIDNTGSIVVRFDALKGGSGRLGIKTCASNSIEIVRLAE